MRKALQAPTLKSGGASTALPPDTYTPPATQKQQTTSNSNIEFRGNPVYSPDSDSLAKATKKIAALKRQEDKVGDQRKPVATLIPSRPSRKTSDAAAAVTPGHDNGPRGAIKQEEGEENSSNSNNPAAQAKGNEDMPLAARSLIAKRHRRRSVFQRPSRYGEWFDGDDDELDRMVESSDDDDNDRGDDTEIIINRPRSTSAEQEHAILKAAMTPSMQKTKTMPSSSKTPLLAPPGSDIVRKVRAIADGLCERLDGLIEESPALPRGGRKDEKSLRDKLLESWEGRSYYDRLMQIAGGSAEQDGGEEGMGGEAGKKTKGKNGSGEEGEESSPSSGPAAPPGVLSFLSPPKPKMRAELAAALEKATSLVAAGKTNPTKSGVGLPVPSSKQMASKSKSGATTKTPPLPLSAMRKTISPKVVNSSNATTSRPSPATVPSTSATTSTVASASPSLSTATTATTTSSTSSQRQQQQQQQHKNKGSLASLSINVNAEPARGLSLLKVSARGSKPMQAPWQQQAAPATTSTTTSTRPSQKNLLRAVATEASSNPSPIESLQAELAETKAARDAAEADAATVRETIRNMEVKLEELEEDLLTERSRRVVAEKRIHVLEAEVASAEKSSAAMRVVNKVGDEMDEVEGTFGLIEVQLESIVAAANALAQQVAIGKNRAQGVVELVRRQQEEHEEGGGGPRKGKTTRRKSAWRG